MQQLQLDQVSIAPNVIELGNLVLQGLRARLERNARGVWKWPWVDGKAVSSASSALAYK